MATRVGFKCQVCAGVSLRPARPPLPGPGALAVAAAVLLVAMICLALLSIAPSPSPPPTRSARAPAGERTLYIGSPDGASLAATYRSPTHRGKAFPAVLIIPELIYADHDGVQRALGAANAPYRLLAERLASAGIASLRYDQRGLGDTRLQEGTGLGGLSAQEQDVAAVFDALAAQPGVDHSRIAVLGHGTGGLLAMAAADANPRIKAVVVAETAGRDLGTVLVRHVEDHILPAYGDRAAQLRDQLEQAVAQLHADGSLPKELDQALTPYLPPDRAELLHDLLAVDPLRVARQLEPRMLIFTGRLDAEVTAEDASLLASAVPHAETAVGAATGHFLEQLPDLAADPSHAAQMARISPADTDQEAIERAVTWLRSAVSA